MISNTTHIGLLTFACDFEETVIRSAGTEPFRISLAEYYILGHAIELGLKSYLVMKGLNEKCLRKIGHDLEKVFSSALSSGISEEYATPELCACIEILNPHYSTKELEYFIKAKGMRLPKQMVLQAAVRKLLSGLDAYYRNQININ